jgi:hypothetical protein
MDENLVTQSTQFVLKKLAIVTKAGIFDIDGMFEELNIYDSMFNPCLSGSVLIKDAIGLTNKFSFDGSEVLIVDMGKTENTGLIRKSFRIYKQSNRKSVNPTTETYILHFVSDEFIVSQQLKINKSYEGLNSETVLKILEEYLGIKYGSGVGSVEGSSGIKKIVIPNLSPIDSLIWLAKRTVNYNLSPSYLFFENRWGYNFITISELMNQETSYSINYEPKNLGESDSTTTEFFGARYLEVISQFDYNKSVRTGQYASTLVGFDAMTGHIGINQMDYDSLYSTTKRANKTPNIGFVSNRDGEFNTEMYSSRVDIFPIYGSFAKQSNYVKTHDPKSITFVDDTYNYIQQRSAIIKNLMNQRIKLVMSGNFDYTSGLKVYVDVPKLSEISSADLDNRDYSLSGNYLIVSTKHLITPQKHETIMEVATDSNERREVYKSSAIQESVAESDYFDYTNYG